MKKQLLSLAMLVTVVGCANVPEQRDQYMNASFELCATDVKLYSVSRDRIRIVCADESRFALNNHKTLDYMRDINMDYCMGAGLGMFMESDLYVMFRCKSGELISLSK